LKKVTEIIIFSPIFKFGASWFFVQPRFCSSLAGLFYLDALLTFATKPIYALSLELVFDSMIKEGVYLVKKQEKKGRGHLVKKLLKSLTKKLTTSSPYNNIYIGLYS